MKKCLGVIKLLVEKRSIELPSLHLSETMFHAQMGEELTSDKRKKMQHGQNISESSDKFAV